MTFLKRALNRLNSGGSGFEAGEESVKKRVAEGDPTIVGSMR